MPESLDPTRPIRERTPEQLGEFIDDHLIMALTGADLLNGARQDAEDYIRDRLVALSDSWDTPEELTAEDARRRMARLRASIGL